ncbi:hypothetical protein CMO89_01180 [Candidatus Woesearchaeota archaeon]|nr:hypothetical protein [Candidatus Woesearchaeota archaeon]|tara:strand:+ start:11763 stop:12167 length:405 start_codon:yes stop_codon:yes gene_type:complete
MLSTFNISSSNKTEMIDVTSKIEEIIAKSNIKEGLCNVYVPHATAAVIINENYDPNILLDIQDALSSLIAEGKWRHDSVDNNGAAHIKASILGPSETIPINEGKLLLGQWQNICVADFDGPRERKVIVTLIKTS